MKRMLNNEEVYFELPLGCTFLGLNDTGYATYHVHAFEWENREDKDKSILYLVTKDGMKFIWGKEAFLSVDHAEAALKRSDKNNPESSHEEKTNPVKRSGNTYFDRIMAELDRQDANAKNMPHHHCCCCGKGDEKPTNNLFSNSSAINTLSDMVVEGFDSDNQDLILIEEMSELTKELLKARRGKDNADEIREEMCHVLTSIEVVRKLMGIPLEELNEEVEKKLKEYGKDKADSTEPPCEVTEISEDASKEIEIKNAHEAIKLFEENSEKNLKIEKNGKLYDVNDFFQHCIGEKSAFIIRSFRLLPEEELREMDASPYEKGINTEELVAEIKNCSLNFCDSFEDCDEYLEDAYFALTLDNWEFYTMTAEVNEEDIVLRSTNSLLGESEED